MNTSVNKSARKQKQPIGCKPNKSKNRSTHIEQTLVLARAEGDRHRLKEIGVETAVDDFTSPFEKRVKGTWGEI